MMTRSDNAITIGKIAGAPVRIAPGSALVGMYIAFTRIEQWSGQGSFVLVAALGILTGVAFLASILAHEAAHALVARRQGIRTEEIRLTLFGGAAALERGAPDPASEMKVAAAGPATNLVLAAVLIGAIFGLQAIGVDGYGLDALVWIGGLNLLLGVFNLLPGLPLDGGSVLTGFLWRRRDDRASAVRTTAKVGKGLGVLMFALAAFEVVVLRSFLGLYTGFIGLIFFRGADAEVARTTMVEGLKGRTVNDVAMFEPPVIDDTVTTAAARALLPSPVKRRWAIVKDAEGVARGLLDLVVLDRAASADGTDSVVGVMVPVDQHRAAFSTETLEDVIARGVRAPFVVINELWQPVALVESLSTRAAPTA